MTSDSKQQTLVRRGERQKTHNLFYHTVRLEHKPGLRWLKEQKLKEFMFLKSLLGVKECQTLEHPNTPPPTRLESSGLKWPPTSQVRAQVWRQNSSWSSELPNNRNLRWSNGQKSLMSGIYTWWVLFLCKDLRARTGSDGLIQAVIEGDTVGFWRFWGSTGVLRRFYRGSEDGHRDFTVQIVSENVKCRLPNEAK